MDFSDFIIELDKNHNLNLKPVFGGLEPWKAGYEVMLRAAQQGGGHSPEMAAKTGQAPVNTTNDPWLDTHVLGYLKTHNCFVDRK